VKALAREDRSDAGRLGVPPPSAHAGLALAPVGLGGRAARAPWAARLRGLSARLDQLGERVVLFRKGPWVFASFGLFGGLGALLTTAGTGAVLVGQGFAPQRFTALAASAGVAVFAGSWLLGQLLEWRRSPRPTLGQLRRPVFVSWGGLLGLLLSVALFSGAGAGALPWMLDALARALFFGHAVGRLGCLSYGCCFGRPTRGPLSITYRNPRAKAVRVGGRHGVPLQPAALDEALLECGLAVAVNAIAIAGAPLGAPTALAACGYGIIRFAVECLREPTDRGRQGGPSLNQRIALLTLGVGIAWAAGVLAVGAPAAPRFDAGGLLPALPWLAASSLTAGGVVFLGFSLHRREIGRW
jgi:hypothetical protein